jgi:predicted metal-dependent hydrolase
MWRVASPISSSARRARTSRPRSLAHPFVLDYLAAHEVAHIVHMNHSPLFWKLTRRLHPGTDRAEIWLKVHGANLHRFGATRE